MIRHLTWCYSHGFLSRSIHSSVRNPWQRRETAPRSGTNSIPPTLALASGSMIIANDQDNRTTPFYVGFTNTERLIGDAAKNQVAMNPISTVFGSFLASFLRSR
ncbi:hypothetical protein MLD38_032643 [Melastoma candidum]|uniref:Uncharacterized protein n=1 Tax=Melastoma candidum TaxID=119954 RepID=A0ACB9M693_9MYRT|nr:hypothetical protein MLD38_032643 [Melastoma candidum]